MMKQVFLLLILSIATTLHAQQNIPSKNYAEKKQELFKKTTLKPELKSELKSTVPTSRISKKTEMLNRLETKSESFKPSIQPGFQKASRNVAAHKERLDSVIYIDNLGNNIYKMTFTFNDKFWPIQEAHLLWNENTEIYESVEEFIFDWRDDGYMSASTILYPLSGEGLKIEYTYNDRNLGDSETLSLLIDNQWEPVEKHTYKYDERENITEFQLSLYEEATWIPLDKEISTYNEHNQQTGWESYQWNGEWDGMGKEEYEWYLPTAELLTLVISYQWNEQSRTWEHVFKREQAFDNGKITLQADSYWNPQRENWSGEIEDGFGGTIVNTKTVFEYDDQDHEILQVASQYIGGTWIPGFAFETYWSVAGNGEPESSRKGYLYSSATEREHIQELTIRYSPYHTSESEKYSYRKESAKFGEDWLDLYEEIYGYNNTGLLLEETWWRFENNVKFADISTKYEYDDNGNETQLLGYMGQGESEDDWALSVTIKREYENNIPIRRYSYEGEELIPASGNGDDYDFNVPASELILFVGNDMSYKLLHTYDYYGNGTDFDTWTKTFYYSDHEVGIKNANNSAVSVYPNPVTNVLNIHSAEETLVSIYNVTGTKLIQTSDKKIDVSALVSGIYIVDINGVKAKIVKQ